MAKPHYILSIDQGTSSTRSILVNRSGKVLQSETQTISQIYPHAGWVEQDPTEIFESCLVVIEKLLNSTNTSPDQIAAIGITNQRETSIVWNRKTGKPVANAIVWQCRRTSDLCEKLKSRGLEEIFNERTGLPIDAYFSATKIRWILDKIPEGQTMAESGDLIFGTIDRWILWNLTNGSIHATDVTNASRTMLFNINRLKWDVDLIAELDLPLSMFAKVKQYNEIFAYANKGLFKGSNIPIAGIAGDQHAALFGQTCFQNNMTKNTYGTGSFILMNTGHQRIKSTNGLITTPAWSLNNTVTYALEGSIFSTGSTVQWLRDGLEIINNSSETETLATSIQGTNGVYLIPAFTGLGAPYWNMHARGAIIGLTANTKKSHIARAALESTAYQTRAIIDIMIKDTGTKVPTLRVDGGGSVNNFLMQFQSDILGIPVERSSYKVGQDTYINETTAVGAAYIAGLAIGFWKNLDNIESIKQKSTPYDIFEPHLSEDAKETLYSGWEKAVKSSLVQTTIS